MKSFKVLHSINGSDTEAVTPSDDIWIQDLDSDTGVTISVPENANMAIMTFTGLGVLYVRFGGVAMTAVPPGTGAMNDISMNPYSRIIEDEVTEIHFISDTNGRLSVEFYR